MHSKVVVVMVLSFVLGSCGWVKDEASLSLGLMEVHSDCVQEQPSGEVTVVAGADDRFLADGIEAFGLPSPTLVKVADNELNSAGDERNCKALMFERMTRELMFVCYEAGAPVCVVTMSRKGE